MISTCKHCRETTRVSLNKDGTAVVCSLCNKEFALENKLMMEILKQNKTTETTKAAEVLVKCDKCGDVMPSVDNKNRVVCSECNNEVRVNPFMRKIIMAQAGVNASLV